jgi:hypothetical protein
VDDWRGAVGRAVHANLRHRPVEVGRQVVTRTASPGTATVHSLLRHLRDMGLECVPEPLELRDGIEKLRFIEGESGGQGWFHQHTDEGLASAAKLLRTIHDATVDWSPPDEARWGAPAVPGDEIVYCQGDPGPWNFVWREQEAVALVDWDHLHPAPRRDDVAYALRWFAPMRSDEFALEWHHFPEIPDRRHRIQVFLDAYGDLPAFDIVDTVCSRIQAVRALASSLAEQGYEPHRTWVEDGSLDRDAAEMRWIESNRDLLF